MQTLVQELQDPLFWVITVSVGVAIGLPAHLLSRYDVFLSIWRTHRRAHSQQRHKARVDTISSDFEVLIVEMVNEMRLRQQGAYAVAYAVLLAVFGSLFQIYWDDTTWWKAALYIIVMFASASIGIFGVKRLEDLTHSKREITEAIIKWKNGKEQMKRRI